MTETDSAFNAGRLSGLAQTLELGKYHIVPTTDGVEEIDLTGDQYLDYPNRLRAAVNVTDVASLLGYWDKHNDTDSDVWADRNARTITAVIDAHHGKDQEPEFRPRWQAHRAVLTLSYSEPFKAWLDRNGRIGGQVEFAEFCESWMGYIFDPPAADLVEMVQLIQATTKANFKSGFKLSNGQRVLEWSEQIDATVNGGSLEVPTSMTLRLPLWRGADTAVELTARIRIRVNHGGPGQLGIGYNLDQPTEVIDAAFEAEVEKVEKHIGRPVLRGAPA